MIRAGGGRSTPRRRRTGATPLLALRRLIDSLPTQRRALKPHYSLFAPPPTLPLLFELHGVRSRKGVETRQRVSTQAEKHSLVSTVIVGTTAFSVTPYPGVEPFSMSERYCPLRASGPTHPARQPPPSMAAVMWRGWTYGVQMPKHRRPRRGPSMGDPPRWRVELRAALRIDGVGRAFAISSLSTELRA